MFFKFVLIFVVISIQNSNSFAKSAEIPGDCKDIECIVNLLRQQKEPTKIGKDPQPPKEPTKALEQGLEPTEKLSSKIKLLLNIYLYSFFTLHP